MLKHLCESCVHGEVKIVKHIKYYNYPEGMHEVESLSTWCKLTWQNKRLIITYCKNYVLKPNCAVETKVNGKTKRMEQKTLW